MLFLLKMTRMKEFSTNQTDTGYKVLVFKKTVLINLKRREVLLERQLGVKEKKLRESNVI
jgi:hypothetical protein